MSCKTCIPIHNQLAAPFGVAQHTLANYEAGALCPHASAVPTAAEHLDSSIDVLLGEHESDLRGKGGPAPKIQQQLEQVAQSPIAKQRFVSQRIESVLAHAGR